MGFLGQVVSGFLSIANLASQLAQSVTLTVINRSVAAGLGRRLRQRGLSADQAVAGGLLATGRAAWTCPICGGKAKFKRSWRYWMFIPVTFVWWSTAIVIVAVAGHILGEDAPTVIPVLIGLAGLALLGGWLAAFIEVQSREFLTSRRRVRCRQCFASGTPYEFLTGRAILAKPEAERLRSSRG